ncbi:MAG: lipopolysaccharide heptosyltransferase II [Deltaproteobacteria bacterium]|nr:lipopolysaccharide heptosyltransferase II [Deltaproteobacteria bacterium]
MTPDPSKIHRILVRMPNWVGDVVMSLPALEALRENFPGCALAVLAKPWVVPLLEGHPCVDEVVVFRKRGTYPRDIVHLLKMASEIRSRRFDLAVLFQNAFEAALLARLAGIPRRVGYNTDGRGLLLSHAIPRKKEVLMQHQVEYYLSILRGMNWAAESRDPRLYVKERESTAVRSLLHSRGIGDRDYLLGLAPGAIYGPAKRWPPERFAAVGDMAANRWGAKVVVMGSKDEGTICEAVSVAMTSPVLNLCGRITLGEAMAVIGRCRTFVTNDSGLMHVAAALDVPLVAIFGSTDPVATGPRNRRARVVRRPMPCSPCLKPECTEGYGCLTAIEPGRVWDELVRLRKEEG